MLTAGALLDYEKLARQGASWKGRLPKASFGRLAAWVDCRSDIALAFRLSLDSEGRPRVQGSASLEVRLVCQKCLAAMDAQLGCDLDAVIVQDEAALAALAPELDGLLAPGRRVAAADLFEDELLLALPMSPRHEEGRCSLPQKQGAQTGPPVAGPEAQQTQRPFASLGARMARQSKRRREKADGGSAEQGHPLQAGPQKGA